MGILTAVACFALVALTITALRERATRTETVPHDGPKRLPDPSPRDLHAISGTLGRAPVPSWG